MFQIAHVFVLLTSLHTRIRQDLDQLGCHPGAGERAWLDQNGGENVPESQEKNSLYCMAKLKASLPKLAHKFDQHKEKIFF